MANSSSEDDMMGLLQMQTIAVAMQMTGKIKTAGRCYTCGRYSRSEKNTEITTSW